jgi:hypothetical protein
MRISNVYLPLFGLALLAVPVAGKAATGPQPFYAAYKSWYVACDNTGACTARGFPADGGSAADVTITRDAGAAGTLTAQIRAQDAFDQTGLTLDGAPLGLTAGWTKKTSDGETSLSATGLDSVRAFVHRIRNGAALGLGGDTTVPLDGLSAALLRMDAAQGRVGGVTALLNPGAKPASEVPPPAALPVIPTQAVTASLAPGEAAALIAVAQTANAARLKTEACDTTTDTDQPSAYALSKTQALVLLPCLMGAYQGSSLGTLVNRQDKTVSPLTLPLSFGGNPSPNDPNDMLTGADFEPGTGTLSMAAKGRGLGDCGISASWIWNGAAFQVATLDYQDACGGAEPGDWPTLYRSQQ